MAETNKQGTTLRMNARMFNGNNLPHELLLKTRQTTKLRNAIENNLQTDIKLSKAQISKIIQSGGFLGKILGPLLKTGLALLKSVIVIVISNGEMNEIMKIAQALEYLNTLLKGVTKTIKTETKEQKGGFLSMLLGTLGASLVGDLLTKNLSEKGTLRAGEGFLSQEKGLKKALMLAHPLTNCEIQEYYKAESRFNGIYSRDNLPKTMEHM